MNKLTTIKTIKKAAPLALLAVVMSGSAFAGKPAGKASIDVFNDCRFEEYEIKDYVQVRNPRLIITTTITDESDDPPGATPPIFGHYEDGNLVTSESLQVFVSQKGMKAKGTRGPSRFEAMGNEDAEGVLPFVNVAKLGDTTTTIPLCESYDLPLNDDSTVLNADIVIEVVNSKFGAYAGKCDDDPSDNTYLACSDPATQNCDENDEFVVDENGDPIVEIYGPDQSIVNIPAGVCTY